ncbi:hypothetical protein PIB30_076246 [Stylosanthes scabra]|uniref:Uncharacterized protein n=1 Tax=Stylosanthes scabra TaxID=79078 RepID=A0ABU6RQI9_9FABA|nr:hypothetical protein [Stylosanthes scabra]
MLVHGIAQLEPPNFEIAGISPPKWWWPCHNWANATETSTTLSRIYGALLCAAPSIVNIATEDWSWWFAVTEFSIFDS